MLLRHRTLTPDALAARRANALKSTGPRTEQGKARVALNSLKHGRSAVNLPEKLARAGHRHDEAEWRQIRRGIARACLLSPPSKGVPLARRISGEITYPSCTFASSGWMW